MGTYTGLRCKVKLKNEFVPIIEKMIKNTSWAKLGYDFLDDFEVYSRSNLIPFGPLCSVPNSWNTEKALCEWKTRIEDEMWIFQCSLKDYDNTIQYFFINVLSKIAESSQHIEVLYGSYGNPVMLEIFDGNVTKVDGETSINYE